MYPYDHKLKCYRCKGASDAPKYASCTPCRARRREMWAKSKGKKKLCRCGQGYRQRQIKLFLGQMRHGKYFREILDYVVETSGEVNERSVYRDLRSLISRGFVWCDYRKRTPEDPRSWGRTFHLVRP